MGELKQERATRPGMEDLFDAAEEFGVPVAVVSNALSGAVHRDYMQVTGLDKRVALQVYSDEVQVRKPNPEMIFIATRALGIPASEAGMSATTSTATCCAAAAPASARPC